MYAKLKNFSNSFNSYGNPRYALTSNTKFLEVKSSSYNEEISQKKSTQNTLPIKHVPQRYYNKRRTGPKFNYDWDLPEENKDIKTKEQKNTE